MCPARPEHLTLRPLGWQLGSCSTPEQEASLIPTELQAPATGAGGVIWTEGVPQSSKQPAPRTKLAFHSLQLVLDTLQLLGQLITSSLVRAGCKCEAWGSCPNAVTCSPALPVEEQHTHTSGSWAGGALLTPLSMSGQGPVFTFTPASGAWRRCSAAQATPRGQHPRHRCQGARIAPAPPGKRTAVGLSASKFQCPRVTRVPLAGYSRRAKSPKTAGRRTNAFCRQETSHLGASPCCRLCSPHAGDMSRMSAGIKVTPQGTGAFKSPLKN